MMEENKQGLFTMGSGDGSQPYNYGVGLYGSKFLMHLRDHGELLGIKCP